MQGGLKIALIFLGFRKFSFNILFFVISDEFDFFPQGKKVCPTFFSLFLLNQFEVIEFSGFLAPSAFEEGLGLCPL